MDQSTTISGSDVSAVPSSCDTTAVVDNSCLVGSVENKPRTTEDEAGTHADTWICLVDDVADDESCLKSVQKLNCPVARSRDGKIPREVPEGCSLAIICGKFEGPSYDRLWSCVREFKSRHVRILGPPCLHYCAAKSLCLPESRRPVFSRSMAGLSVCFMGFKPSEKSILDHLVSLVHLMEGEVRKSLNRSSVTHVISRNVTSSRYEVAVAFSVPIMSSDWVEECWKRRHDWNVSATNEDLMQYHLPPFTGLTLRFCGFEEEEQSQMEHICTLNGGNVAGDGQSYTHCVCSSDMIAPPDDLPSPCSVVKSEWFWESVQIRACTSTSLYAFRRNLVLSPGSTRSPLRSRGSLAPLRQNGVRTMPSSLSSNLERNNSTVSTSGDSPQTAKLKKRKAERKNKALELMMTEKNYVEILEYIVEHFVAPLERHDQRGGAILKPEEVKEMFDPLPCLARSHRKILTALEHRFGLDNWSDEICFGDILVDHIAELIHIYPRFINFYEARKECVTKRMRSDPRFTAFVQLRYSEASKSSGPFAKQKLTELLITPVQRMPRYLLLLEGIIKLTADDHKDKEPLKKALEGFRLAAQRINEDKRIAEGRLKILNLPNVIEDLPPTIVSATRSIVEVVNNVELFEMIEMEKLVVPVSLIIFSDGIEIVKRRGGRESISVEELGSASSGKSSKRPLRHIDFLLLSQIEHLIHFESSAEDGSHSLRSDFLGIVVDLQDGNEQLILLHVTATGLSLDKLTKLLQDSVRRSRFYADDENLVQVYGTDSLPFAVDQLNVEAGKVSKTFFKGARVKARRVQRVLTQQVHQLTPRRQSSRQSRLELSLNKSRSITESVTSTGSLTEVGGRLSGNFYSPVMGPPVSPECSSPHHTSVHSCKSVSEHCVSLFPCFESTKNGSSVKRRSLPENTDEAATPAKRTRSTSCADLNRIDSERPLTMAKEDLNHLDDLAGAGIRYTIV